MMLHKHLKIYEPFYWQELKVQFLLKIILIIIIYHINILKLDILPNLMQKHI